MGRIFTAPPSPYEADHVAAYRAGVEYQQAHDGSLPDGPAWRMLERRYDINPLRFTHWHPNFSSLIARGRTIDKPDVWPIDRCSPYQAECRIDPPPHGGGTHPQVVPEPSSGVLWLLAIAWAGVMWRRSR